MKAVMYHYVRNQPDRPPDYYHLDSIDFKRQLDYFEENFGFVSKDEFLGVVRGKTKGSLPSGVLLTFDDGLRDHYDVVFPELQKRGLWGTFYVPTGPYETGSLLDVHRVHVVLGRVSGDELLEHVKEVVNEDMVPHRRREEYREKTYERQKDTKPTKQAKRILNYFVANEYRTEVLDRINDRLGYQQLDISDFYVTENELQEMHDNGMVIGAHTVTHPVLSKLDRDRQLMEIRGSFDFLDKTVGGLSAKTFCYPYGHEYSFNEDTVSVLGELECKWCFKVEPNDVKRSDINDRLHSLPRYDCTEFPHGESSGSIGSSD